MKKRLSFGAVSFFMHLKFINCIAYLVSRDIYSELKFVAPRLILGSSLTSLQNIAV